MKCNNRKTIENKYIIIIHICKRNINLRQIYDLSGSLKIISQNNLKQRMNEFRNMYSNWYFSKLGRSGG